MVPVLAVIVATVTVPTDVVLTGNVPVFVPLETVIVVGTVALVELDFRFTTTPPTGAAVLRVTVAVAEVPPLTATGAMVNPVGDTAVTLRF